MNHLAIICLSLLFLGACIPVPPVDCPPGHPMVKGTVRDYTGLDGCGFVIELSNSEVVEPVLVNDTSFIFHDNQKIWFSYQSVPYGSICMVGDVVEVLCIRER